MDNKDNGCCEDEHGGIKGNAMIGATDEGAKYDSDEVSDDTEDLSDDEYLDFGLENLSNSDGKEEAEPTNIPILGMTFESDQDAYDCYNSYARFVGFSVRKKRSNTSGTVKSYVAESFVALVKDSIKKRPLLRRNGKKRDLDVWQCLRSNSMKKECSLSQSLKLIITTISSLVLVHML